MPLAASLAALGLGRGAALDSAAVRGRPGNRSRTSRALGLEPAAVSCFWKVSAPQAGQVVSTGSAIFCSTSSRGRRRCSDRRRSAWKSLDQKAKPRIIRGRPLASRASLRLRGRRRPTWWCEPWRFFACGPSEPTTMPTVMAIRKPASWAGKVAGRVIRNSSQAGCQHDGEHRALRGGARPVSPHQRHKGADQRHLVGARDHVVDRRALHARWRRPARRRRTPARRCAWSSSSRLSLMRGKNWRQMFSTEGHRGRQQRGRAVDLIADSSAPKNSTCITKGIFSSPGSG